MTGSVPATTKNTTLLAAAIIAAINIASLILDRRDREYELLMAVDLGHTVIALGVAGALARTRRVLSARACDIAFAIVVAPFLVGIWLPQTYDLQHGRLFEPMLAHHFLMLGIAVVAPSTRSGTVWLLVFTAHALVLGYTLSLGVATPSLEREPWFTLFFGAIAGMLLYARVRRHDLEQRLAASEERARTLAQVSQVLLALRDRANTPLQTLQVAISLLEPEVETDDPRVILMRRAVARLTAIQHTLAQSGVRSTQLSPLELEPALRDLLAD